MREYKPLTDAWKPCVLDPRQAAYLSSPATINYNHAGRRSFKTQGAKYRIVRAAIATQKYPDARYFAAAPTHQQSKDIFWDDLKALTPDWALDGTRYSAISESELTISMWNGARVKVVGLDRPERVEGKFWDGGVISEYAECEPGLFQEHIFPMMLRGGWVDLESTPEGRNFFAEEVDNAIAQINSGDPLMMQTYAVHHWATWEVLHLYLGEEKAKHQLRIMKSGMDELTWRQEAGGEFVHFVGRAYYNFSAAEHVRPVKYDPSRPLILCFDFNVDPGTCVYVQEQPCTIPGFGPMVTVVLGEVFIPQSSNTPTVCRKIIADWRGDGDKPEIANHTGAVLLYGDPAGGQRSTKFEDGNDWSIIEDMLGRVFDIESCVPRSSPRQRARVNSVNSRLRTSDGIKHLVISRDAKQTIRDLDMMRVKKGTAGELDEGSDKKKKTLGHLTAGLGYYLHETQQESITEMQEEQGQVAFVM